MATAVDICNIALVRLGHAPDLVTTLSASGNTSERACNILYPIARDALLNEHNWNFAIKRRALVPNATEPVFEYTQAYDLPSDYLRIIRTNLDLFGSKAVYTWGYNQHESGKWRVEGATLLSDTAPGTATAITGATQANPVVITSALRPPDGASVLFASVGGMTDLNGNIYTVDNPTGTTFELQNTDGTGFGAYTSGGTAQVLNVEVEYLSLISDPTLFPQWFVDLLADRLAAELAPRLTDNANIANSMWDKYNTKLAVTRNRDATDNDPRGITAELFVASRL